MSAILRLSRVGGNPGPGSLRPLQVLIDGQKAEPIKLGETKTYTVTAGNHRVQVKQDFSASDPVTLKLEDGTTQALECGSYVEGVMFFFVVIWAWRTLVPGKLFYLKRRGAPAPTQAGSH